ncbi:hypothetical protein [Algihabitans albus]|uniref:hypothetical protein n=1 Tax=Algihabitans albus TaxID=2164067 RepID=UPI0013C30F8A|nr:hypothetical protein [Algihabitans albus]
MRAAAKSQLTQIRGELQGLKSQRSFVRRRIRDEMRAQLMNLNADVDRLRGHVQETVRSLKNSTGTLAAERRQQTAAFRASLGEQIAQRRQDTQRLLTQFGDARAEQAARTRARLSDGLSELRTITADVLSAHRAERARLSASWAEIKRRRELRATPPIPLTLTDPAQDAAIAQTFLSSNPPSPTEMSGAREATAQPPNRAAAKRDGHG